MAGAHGNAYGVNSASAHANAQAMYPFAPAGRCKVVKGASSNLVELWDPAGRLIAIFQAVDNYSGPGLHSWIAALSECDYTPR